MLFKLNFASFFNLIEEVEELFILGDDTYEYSNDAGNSFILLDPLGNLRQTNGMAYSPTLNLYILAGTSNTSGGNCVGYSTDGITNWNFTGGSIFTKGTNSVAWSSFSKTFVVVGSDNTIAYSIDGKIFTQTSTSINGNYQKVVYGNNKFLVTGFGTGDTIASSEDGITWISGGKTVLSPRDAVYANGKWVAVSQGNLNAMYYSTDNALTWIGTGGIDIVNQPFVIAFNGTNFCVGGQPRNNTPNNIATSNDGITWVGSINNIHNVILGIILDKYNNYIVSGFGSSIISKSTDNAISWYTTTTLNDGAYGLFYRYYEI
jgi:hypothetical protein